MEDRRQRDIALFRYGLIRAAADADLSPAERGRLVPARVTDLRRTGAWPLVGWAILTGHITADLELLLVKDFGTLGEAAERLMPVDFADAHAAADRLGWSATWARSIVREALVLTIAATGRTLRQLTADDLDALGEQIAACPLITEAARKRHRAQLFGLAQLLFECRVIDAPPVRRYPPAASIHQRFAAALPDTPIRAAMIRYVTARAAVLAASSVDGLANDLIPFRGLPRRPPPARDQPGAARPRPHRGLPRGQPHPHLARPGGPRPAGVGQRRARRGARAA